MPTVVWINGKTPGSQNLSAGGYSPIGLCGAGTATNETDLNLPYPIPGTISRFWARISTNDRAQSTIIMRVATADGTISLTIPASTTGAFEDLTHADHVEAGKDVQYKITVGAGGTTFTTASFRTMFRADAYEAVTRVISGGGNSVTLNGVTRYYSLLGSTGGDTTPNQTEAYVQMKAPFPGQLRNLIVRLTANAKGGNSFGRFRINGANASSSVTVPASTTGTFQDLSNRETVAAGDLMNYSFDFFADGNSCRPAALACDLVGFRQEGLISHAASVQTQDALTAGAATSYYNAGTAPADNQTNETSMQQPLHRCIASIARVRVNVNTITATSTFTLRKNAADTAIVLSVPSSTTGWFEDLTNSASYEDGDMVSWKAVPGATGTSLQFNNLMAMLVSKEPPPAQPGIPGRPWPFHPGIAA